MKKYQLTNYKTCDSVWKKARGMMFTSRKHAQTLLFPFSTPRRVGLHMLFVFFPLNIVVLNEKKRVVEIKKLYPFDFFTTKKAQYIIEFIDDPGLSAGNRVKF